MAWRDSRTSRKRLLLFSSSIVLGIAALTAIGSLGVNLRQAIDGQARMLLGADLALSSRREFSPEEERLFQRLGGAQARETSLTTMIYFSRNEATRLIQLRALAGGFPFYGKLETEPGNAADEFQRGDGALVEESLLTQFNARVGDTIRLGKLTTRIAGSLKKVPGETVAFAAMAPRVYLSMDGLQKAGLLRPESLARFKVYFQFRPGLEVEKLVEEIQPELDKFRLNSETVAQRKRDLGRAMDNLYHFLNLAGFIALLLGGVGVAGATQAHVKEKLVTVAVLRCLGGSIAQTFAIYLAQAMALGLFGSILGAALGLAIQSALPKVLADFIPFSLPLETSWWTVARAIAIGFVSCVLFALLPLLAVRRVSPLAALRATFEPSAARRDPLRRLVGICLAAGILVFALFETRDWRMGLGFTAGLAVAFVLLAGTAKMLMLLTRRCVSPTLPFVWRQGLANLHRPNNRTLLLLLSLGLGTFLMAGLYLVQQTLLTQLVSAAGRNQANTILFDIQPDQREGVTNAIHSLHLPLLDEAPIITMRLASVKDRTVESLLADKQRPIQKWTLRHEYRCTFSDHLRDGEKLVAGTWHPETIGNGEVAPISLEEGVAKDLRVGLGDSLVFDVQGVPLKTRVASLREVDWRRVQPNFFVVFPRGVLEDAPAMRVLTTRVPSVEESARLQREMIKRFPNVSIIDLRLVLETLDSILDRISFVVRFMALFTVATGLLVLVGALLTGRYQRIRESVLLRTLGASRGQILKILFVEYLALGLLAALTGIFLAVIGAGALARFVFHVRFAPQATPLIVAALAVPGLTVLTGMLMSRGVLNHPPLSIIRSEL